MTVTEKLAQNMDAARRGMEDATTGLKRIARQADSRHDQAVAALRLEKDEGRRGALEEVRAGLAATGDYCRSLIEAHTGEAPAESNIHDARDETGKFTPEGSVGHLFRKMTGRE